jgi:hypothetical protein
MNQLHQTLWSHVSDEQWNDWHWQMSNRLTTLDDLLEVMPLSPQEAKDIEHEGVISVYQEPENKKSRCKTCTTICPTSKTRQIGLVKLLKGDRVSLTPQENLRLERRKTSYSTYGGGKNA